MSRLPTLFIAHGGGPCFWMDFPPPMQGAFDKLGAYLRGLAAEIGERPKAILVISAHWDEAEVTINAGAAPPMLYDYYGFPEHTYRLNYPAPGAPALAGEVKDLLANAGIAAKMETARGYDHGVFVPFMLIYPEADIPVLQVSLRSDLDAGFHIALGRALVPLRDQGVLIVGSGNSFHNLAVLRRPLPPGADDEKARAFDNWLQATTTNPDPAARDAGLTSWAEAPNARACHPREEHLIPLMVAAGAAGSDVGRQVYADHMAGHALSGFQFG
jgi:aromatic ring-opening dioxygenase catalytic subunit (LigB family)